MTLTTRPLLWLWGAVAVQLVGRLLDARWHATHDEFEGASEQLAAHWLAWLGVLATLAVSSALARAGSTRDNRGYLLTAVGAGAYVPVAVWHFVEHAGGSDPAIAHVLIGLTQATMFVGVVAATVIGQRRARVSGR